MTAGHIAPRAGTALTVLVALFLAFDAGIKLVPLDVVRDTLLALGWPGDVATARMLGVILGLCLLLYLWPRTAVLGAILLTACLGGAVAAHVRLGNPAFSHTLFGVYVGIALWAALWLRYPALRRVLRTPAIRPADQS